MSMLKKVIGVLIVFLLLQMSYVIMQSHAVDEDIFNGVDISAKGDGSVIATLSQDQTTLTISGTGEMKNWRESSDRPWYSYRKQITIIKIKHGVTKIGDIAFYECSSLSSVEISSSVTSIEFAAFQGCSSLSSIEIPSSVANIGAYAFSGCSSLSSIEIPSSVTSIGYSAFTYCSSLRSITVDSNNTKYTSEDGVLFNKEKTIIVKYPAKKEGESYKIPSSVTSIGDYAFRNCSSLSSIEIPSSVTSIGSYAFAGCSSLSSIEISSSVTNIGLYAFAYSNLVIKTSEKEITIPNILKRAMTENDILYTTKEVTLTNCIFSENKDTIKINKADSSEISIKINDGVLSELTIIIVPLEKIDISKNNDGSVTAQISEDLTILTISGTGEMKNWRELSDRPWYSYKNAITRVKINQGVTNIGGKAFCECSSLSSIEIPSSVTSIEFAAFQRCSSLSSIEIPSSVTSIGDYAFQGCSSLSSIEIPSGVTKILSSTFYYCNSLSSITVDSNNTKYTSENGVLFNKDKTILIQYPANKEEDSYKIPSSVTSIGNYAFIYCSKLSSIQLSNGVTSIGSWAFGNCISLDSIEISSSVTKIEGYAFEGCSSLSSIIIPKEVTSISINVFKDCSKLTITCKGGTAAETYAKDNNIKYMADNEVSIKKVEHLPTQPTNQNVTVTITGNEPIREIEGWKLSEDKKTLTKTYEENTEEEITIMDLVGNERTETITINNIDRTAPTVTVNKSLSNDKTKCTVILTANEEIQGITGWTLSKDKKTLTKTYTANTTEEVTVKDLAGNESKGTITITNIVPGVETTLEVNIYSVENNTIKNIQPNTSYIEFIKNITSNKDIVVKERNIILTGTSKIKTGQVLTVGEKTYTLIVTGDTNGDGQADIKDILQINKHRLNKAQLTSAYFTAGDVNKDGKVDIKDILQLNKYRLSKISQL